MNTHTTFGFSRNGVVLLVLLAALLITLLVGLLFAGSAMMRGLIVAPPGVPAPPGLKPVGDTPLLAAILVLLVGNLVLLLTLLWCCCRPSRKGPPAEVMGVLAPLLPMLPQIPDALRVTAIGLKACSNGIGWIQGNIKGAGDMLETAATTAATFDITVPTVDIEATLNEPPPPAPAFYTYKIRGFDANALYYPLTGVSAELQSAATNLKSHTGPGGSMDEVKTSMDAAAKSVGLIAKALGAPPPADVLA